MTKRKSTGVSDPLELIGGGAKDEYAIEKRTRGRTSPVKVTKDGQAQMRSNGAMDTQYHPKAQEFDIWDHELQLVDAILADPYRNAGQAYRLLHPNAEGNGVHVACMNILNKPGVRSYMIWCQENNHTAQVVTREFVLLRLRHVADRALAATPVFDREGQPTGEYKCDFNAANKALELLGKHQGMFKEESRVRVSHDRPLVRITVKGRDDQTESPQPNDHLDLSDGDE